MTDPIAYLYFEASAWWRLRFSNPTRQWPLRTVSWLLFDMTTHALNGVSIEAPLSSARVFGPAEGIGPWEDTSLLYYSLGLQVDSGEGHIVSFRIVMDPSRRTSPSDRRFSPATLEITTRGGIHRTLSRDTHERELFGLFGPPVETGPVLDERTHTFLVDGNFIDTFHDQESGCLVEMELGVTAGASKAPVEPRPES